MSQIWESNSDTNWCEPLDQMVKLPPMKMIKAKKTENQVWEVT